MFDLIIRNGTVVSAGGVFGADVGIRDGRIAALGELAGSLAGDEVIDATGCYVIPGGVDPHVHLQMRLGGRVTADDFAAGTIAAACGGTTTVIDFVDPVPEETLLQALAKRRAEADGVVAVDYGLHMTVPAWHAASESARAEFAAVVQAGCATFKLYMAYPNVMLEDVALLRTLQAAARAGGRVVVHAETGPVLDELRNQALAAGHIEPIWHAKTRPPRLEASAVARAVALAEEAGCPLYIFHVGARAVVEEVRQAQAEGCLVWAETCPQYLLLTAEEHLGGAHGEWFICAPPLRAAADQASLWAGLAQGALSVVSTDHCPWMKAEKQQPDFARVPGGVPGLEARLSLVYHHGVANGPLDLAGWVAVCCTNPARLMGLTGKGEIAPGFDADVVIFDPQRAKRLQVDTLHERCDWTPYAGMEICGWPRTVLLRGRPVVLDEAFCGAGRFVQGRFVARRFD